MHSSLVTCTAGVKENYLWEELEHMAAAFLSSLDSNTNKYPLPLVNTKTRPSHPHQQEGGRGMTFLTVGRLRAALEGLADDALVRVSVLSPDQVQHVREQGRQPAGQERIRIPDCRAAWMVVKRSNGRDVVMLPRDDCFGGSPAVRGLDRIPQQHHHPVESGHREALEAVIAADPHDPDNYRVYADWLEDHGDPDAARACRRLMRLVPPGWAAGL
jgi:uncharacterized protein (TIGR02996 family)